MIGLENELLHEIESGLPDGIVKRWVPYLLKWYSKKAQRYKSITYMATAASILLPAVLALLNTSVLTGWLSPECIEKLKILLPILSSAGAAFYAFLRSKDNWVRYRTSAEQIKQETIHYIAKCAGKESIDPEEEEAFLKTIERICSSELTEWRQSRLEALPDTKKEIDSGAHSH